MRLPLPHQQYIPIVKFPVSQRIWCNIFRFTNFVKSFVNIHTASLVASHSNAPKRWHVEELIERYGTDWPCRWLRECGCEREAEWWQQWRGQDAVHETILGAMWNGDRDGRPWGHDGHQF